MKAVVQRVKKAAVYVEQQSTGEIQVGMLVFIGIGKTDTDSETDWMIRKLLNLRIFLDDEGKMNRSITDIQGEILIVSQFTLYGNARKGTRPSFTEAMAPNDAVAKNPSDTLRHRCP